MAKLLHIEASPRKQRSASMAVARTLLEAYRTAHPDDEIETWDLWEMARLTGHEADMEHWRKAVRRDPKHVRRMFEDRWEMNGVEDYFAGPADGMVMTNGFWAMRSHEIPFLRLPRPAARAPAVRHLS